MFNRITCINQYHPLSLNYTFLCWVDCWEYDMPKKAKELTAYSLTSIHNLHFMVEFMKDAREKDEADSFRKADNSFHKLICPL